MSDDLVQKSLGSLSVSMTKVKKAKTSKQEAALVKVTSLDVNDVFEEFYFDQTGKGMDVLRPPYDLYALKHLCQTNNALGSLITAMEVNIDGTGYVIEPRDSVEGGDSTAIDERVAGVASFFDEIYPEESFVSLRRRLRRDLEETGNAYLEVVRAVSGEVVFLKDVQSPTVRLCRLKDPAVITKEVTRMGVKRTITMTAAERRFVQIVGSTKVYFKQFGASRDLDIATGDWAPTGTRLPADQRASELIHFIVNEDALTPYGVPRWVPQMPSVLGSRKAEELNLDFFRAGGLPPAMIIIQGGSMTAEVRKQVESYLSGKGASTHRAAVIEVFSNSGDLNSSGNVKVSVERFGSERLGDSLFENYDDKCEKRVRSSFRLPPLFVGRTTDYSYATAYASYIVAEAQVFKPEREEFDEIINVKIMNTIAPDMWFRSLPLNVSDATTQLKGVELVANAGALTKGELVDKINEVTNMSLQVAEGLADEVGSVTPAASDPFAAFGKAAAESVQRNVQKADTFELIKLASDFTAHITGTQEFSRDAAESMLKTVELLSPDDKTRFDGYVALKSFGPAIDHDLEGGLELCGCASTILMKHDLKK